MHTPFRLAGHPRRGPQPLSSPPPAYFEQLPTRIMARVASPARQPRLGWLWPAPAYLRTGLASTLLLGTFAASLWLGGGPRPAPAGPTSLDAVPRAQLVEYLTSGETHLDMLDLAELPARRASLPTQYLQPSAAELTAALDAQPADEAGLL